MVNGLVLINKKVSVTSRSVDNKIQRLFHTRKVGHLGTLDPFASGLLVIAIDKGCKCLPFIDDSFKCYEASLRLGIKTDSGDLTGQIIERKEFANLNEEKILAVFNSFIGESEQIPPMTSALHHDGKRLYDLARKGIEVNRPSRKINIYSLKLISFKDDVINFSVKCSKGTYVRTLGEDIAEKLNTVGHLISLKRTSIGNIDISLSKDIDDLKEDDLINPVRFINLKQIDITNNSSLIKDIKDGKKIELDEQEEMILFGQYVNDEFTALAVYNKTSEKVFSPLRGLW